MVLTAKRETTAKVDRQVATVIRVFRRQTLIGSLLLNEAGRLRRRTPDVPSEVVLKVMVQHNRCDESDGAVTARDGTLYCWRVLEEEDEE